MTRTGTRLCRWSQVKARSPGAGSRRWEKLPVLVPENRSPVLERQFMSLSWASLQPTGADFYQGLEYSYHRRSFLISKKFNNINNFLLSSLLAFQPMYPKMFENWSTIPRREITPTLPNTEKTKASRPSKWMAYRNSRNHFLSVLKKLHLNVIA